MPDTTKFLDYQGLIHYEDKIKQRLAGKQDVISDLATIRSQAGSAIQPGDYTTLAGYGISDAYTKGETEAAIRSYAVFTYDSANDRWTTPGSSAGWYKAVAYIYSTAGGNQLQAIIPYDATENSTGGYRFRGVGRIDGTLYDITLSSSTGGHLEAISDTVIFHGDYDTSSYDVTIEESISVSILTALDKPVTLDLTVDGNSDYHILLSGVGYNDNSGKYFFRGIAGFDIEDSTLDSSYLIPYEIEASITDDFGVQLSSYPLPQVQHLYMTYNINSGTHDSTSLRAAFERDNHYYDVILTVTDGTISKKYIISQTGCHSSDDFVGFIEWESKIYKAVIHPASSGQQNATCVLTKISTAHYYQGAYNEDTGALTVSATFEDIDEGDFEDGVYLDIAINDGPASHVIFTYSGVDHPSDEDTLYFHAITNTPLSDWGKDSANGQKIFYNVIAIHNNDNVYYFSKELLKSESISSWAKAANPPAATDISYGNNSNVSAALGTLDSGKADKSTTYTKTEVDTALSAKANQSTTYTKTEVDTALTAKADQSTTYTKTETDSAISTAIGRITQIDFQVVDELPDPPGTKGVIYLVSNSGSGQNVYDEYIWVDPTGGTAHFEKIGTTEVDLQNYWNTSNLYAITNGEIDNIVSPPSSSSSGSESSGS